VEHLYENFPKGFDFVVKDDIRKLIKSEPNIIIEKDYINFDATWKQLTLKEVNSELKNQLIEWIKESSTEINKLLIIETEQAQPLIEEKEKILFKVKEIKELEKKILYEIPIAEQEPLVLKLRVTISNLEREIELLNNELAVAHNKIKGHKASRQLIRVESIASRINLYRNAKLNDIELNQLRKELTTVAEECRKKNYSISFKKLGEKLGVDNKTAKSWCVILGID
jgi:hypothetical protein